VIAGVKPHEKKKFISDLQKQNKVVAMVGDGINDAAALALSDIGIAMGEGVGAASDVSPVVLMGNRLSQVLLYFIFFYFRLFFTFEVNSFIYQNSTLHFSHWQKTADTCT
jgi:P-type E1-E2 ATPase